MTHMQIVRQQQCTLSRPTRRRYDDSSYHKYHGGKRGAASTEFESIEKGIFNIS